MRPSRASSRYSTERCPVRRASSSACRYRSWSSGWTREKNRSASDIHSPAVNPRMDSIWGLTYRHWPIAPNSAVYVMAGTASTRPRNPASLASRSPASRWRSVTSMAMATAPTIRSPSSWRGSTRASYVRPPTPNSKFDGWPSRARRCAVSAIPAAPPIDRTSSSGRPTAPSPVRRSRSGGPATQSRVRSVPTAQANPGRGVVASNPPRPLATRRNDRPGSWSNASVLVMASMLAPAARVLAQRRYGHYRPARALPKAYVTGLVSAVSQAPAVAGDPRGGDGGPTATPSANELDRSVPREIPRPRPQCGPSAGSLVSGSGRHSVLRGDPTPGSTKSRGNGSK